MAKSKTNSGAEKGADRMAPAVVGASGASGRSVAGAGAVGVEPVVITTTEEFGPDPDLFRGMLAPDTVRLERLHDTLHHVACLVHDCENLVAAKRQTVGQKNFNF